ncbi:hypothetical protein IHQ71_30575 (plasmid) [Rhizobium sp. TH2]|uniref:hypothetical protein n=1 Tax=Rhizobium sp. TH2 TaxID=2775403 RepID=UPI0021576896|nr:hypothetical protein [Rhizobium sp. TH2]UVC12361.1 hypothetical protein IHQ71_30575 [Rhizobium sp. TH2]
MISDIAAWLFALFVIDPLQAEMRERLDGANVPVAAVQQSRQCAPGLLQRAGEEPGWAVTTALGVAIGWTAPTQLLDANDPNCTVLIRSLKSAHDQEGEA